MNDLSLILLGLCGGALLCNVAVMLLAVWVTWDKRQRSRPRLRSYSIDRVAADDAPEIVQREIQRGAVWVYTARPQTGIVNLHFVEDER